MLMPPRVFGVSVHPAALAGVQGSNVVGVTGQFWRPSGWRRARKRAPLEPAQWNPGSDRARRNSAHAVFIEVGPAHVHVALTARRKIVVQQKARERAAHRLRKELRLRRAQLCQRVAYPFGRRARRSHVRRTERNDAKTPFRPIREVGKKRARGHATLAVREHAKRAFGEHVGLAVRSFAANLLGACDEPIEICREALVKPWIRAAVSHGRIHALVRREVFPELKLPAEFGGFVAVRRPRDKRFPEIGAQP